MINHSRCLHLIDYNRGQADPKQWKSGSYTFFSRNIANKQNIGILVRMKKKSTCRQWTVPAISLNIKGLLKHRGTLCSQWDLLANIFIVNIIPESGAWFQFAVITDKEVHLVFGFQSLVKWKRERNIYKGALEWLSLHSILVEEAIASVKIPSTWP